MATPQVPDLEQQIETANERIRTADGRIRMLEMVCGLKAKVAALEVESKKQSAINMAQGADIAALKARFYGW